MRSGTGARWRGRAGLVAVLAAVAAGGCTSSGYTCKNEVCTIKANGETDIRLDSLDATVEFTGLDDGRVALLVDGASATLAEGAEQRIGGYRVRAVKARPDSVELRIRR